MEALCFKEIYLKGDVSVRSIERFNLDQGYFNENVTLIGSLGAQVCLLNFAMILENAVETQLIVINGPYIIPTSSDQKLYCIRLALLSWCYTQKYEATH